MRRIRGRTPVYLAFVYRMENGQDELREVEREERRLTPGEIHDDDDDDSSDAGTEYTHQDAGSGNENRNNLLIVRTGVCGLR